MSETDKNYNTLVRVLDEKAEIEENLAKAFTRISQLTEECEKLKREQASTHQYATKLEATIRQQVSTVNDLNKTIEANKKTIEVLCANNKTLNTELYVKRQELSEYKEKFDDMSSLFDQYSSKTKELTELYAKRAEAVTYTELTKMYQQRVEVLKNQNTFLRSFLRLVHKQTSTLCVSDSSEVQQWRKGLVSEIEDVLGNLFEPESFKDGAEK